MRKPRHAEEEAVEELLEIPVDPVNEQICIAAACVASATRKELMVRVRVEHFSAKEHKAIWTVMVELERRNLEFDLATVQTLAAGKVDLNYLQSLVEARPELPDNLDFHVEELMWDHARVTAVNGPVAKLLHALKDPRAERERVKSLGRQVGMSFDSYQDRAFLMDAKQLVRDQSAEIRQRMNGHAIYPYGIPGLDADPAGTPRIIPGAKPGLVTLVTGVSGAGKSTLTANIVLGLARQKLTVLVGAWEMNSGMTLELLACLSLGYSRAAVMTGRLTEEMLSAMQSRMLTLQRYVKFMANPFRRRKGEKLSNERNLDVIQGYIADSGCDVFVADLWRRCLVDEDPGEEEFALYRQQAMLEEMKVHGILVQQQRLKDVESRPDKRPTREGVKGSGAYVEVADTILAANRPALWKRMDDNVFELHVLKQRYGKWPMLMECDWDGERGLISNPREVPYEHAGDAASGSNSPFDGPVRGNRNGAKKWKR